MPAKSGARIVLESRLRLSRAPTAELGAAALQAQDAAGLDAADFVIIAVTPGTADDTLAIELARVAAARATPAPAG